MAVPGLVVDLLEGRVRGLEARVAGLEARVAERDALLARAAGLLDRARDEIPGFKLIRDEIVDWLRDNGTDEGGVAGVAAKVERDAIGPVIEHDNMTGDRLYRGLEALGDGGMSTVAVIRDGVYWPVKAVYMNPDRFVILELAEEHEGPVCVRGGA